MSLQAALGWGTWQRLGVMEGCMWGLVGVWLWGALCRLRLLELLAAVVCPGCAGMVCLVGRGLRAFDVALPGCCLRSELVLGAAMRFA